MGNFTSTAAAYQQLRPLEDKTLDNLLKVENLIASREGRRMKKEKISADASAKKEAALNKGLKDSGLYDSLDTVITGVKSADEILGLGLSKVADERLKIAKQIKSGSVDPNSPEVQTKIANLNSWPKKIKSAFDIMTKNVAAFQKAYQNDEISDWDKGKLDKFSAFFGVEDPETGERTPNFALLLDERGNPYAMGKTQKGDRVTLSINDINSGNTDLFDTRPPVDYVKDMINYATKLGEETTTRIEGPFIVTEQTFDDRRDEVIGFTEDKFGTVESPSDFAKSVWTDEMRRNPEDLDKAGMDLMKGNYVKNVESFYDEKYKKVLDPVFESRQKRLQKDKAGIEKNFIEIVTDQEGAPVKEVIPGVSGDQIHGIFIGEEGFSFSLPKSYTVTSDDATYTVENLYLTEDGKMAFTGIVKEKDPKTDSYETVKFARGGSSVDDLKMFTSVARQIKNPVTKKGFKNLKELKDYLEEVSGIPKKETPVDKGEEKDFSGTVILKSNLKKIAEDQGKSEKEMRSILEGKGVTIR